MKKLVIAEKPSVAKDLAKALGKFKQNKDGYFEKEDMIITSAIGHLVELYMPGDFDKKYSSWSLKNLPILPEKFLLKPIKKSEERFKFLKKMMKRDDISSLINACDAGREGELIFSYLCELIGCDKPKERLWLSSMTTESIRNAFENLRTSESIKLLDDAARCRSEADWLIGINGTRVVTITMPGGHINKVSSVGRVQTPTLAIVCYREQEIATFKSETFWCIEGNFQLSNGKYNGFLQRKPFKKQNENDKNDRFWNNDETKKILDELNDLKNNNWEVADVVKTSKIFPPRLFDLTSLQRECNQRFGYSAKFTLDIAQTLYEKHKVLTYPRTSSRALPEDYGPTCISIFEKLKGEYSKFTEKIIQDKLVNTKSKTLFNNKEVSDHFAIIPTGSAPKTLKESEAKVYDFVVRRFISAFLPASEFLVTTRVTKQGKFEFKTEGKVLSKIGWMEVNKRTETNENLPAICDADNSKANGIGFNIEEDKTRPPSHFTEATLLSSMEHAGQFVEDEKLAEAMKEHGLGTPATRAQIIENLISTKYLDRQGKNLIPTLKAEELLNFLKNAKVEELSKPALTGEWEYSINKIQNGELSRECFMNDIKEATKKMVDSIIKFKDSGGTESETDMLSPTDGKKIVETFRDYKSQDGKIIINKVIGNRKLSEDEVKFLLKEKKIGPLDGFISKFGKHYSAYLILDENYKINFDFGNQQSQPIESIDFSKCELVCKCPLCGKNIYKTENDYICENFKNKKCKLRIATTILGCQIVIEQAKKLFLDKKTDLLEKFTSKRTGKQFSAFLILKKDGTLAFEFKPKSGDKK